MRSSQSRASDLATAAMMGALALAGAAISCAAGYVLAVSLWRVVVVGLVG